MPTPRVSRNASQRSPALSSTVVSADLPAPSDAPTPIDWNANVVNFISSCRHPGLVRRTSLAAQHGHASPSSPLESMRSFRPRHRRNLSAATTVGRYLDTPRVSTKPPYAPCFPYPQTNNYNSYQRTGASYEPRLAFGHARNISDPTACWECFPVDMRSHTVVAAAGAHIPDYPIFPLPHQLHHVSRQLSTTSPERTDEFSSMGQVSPYLPPPLASWQKTGLWDGLEESDGVFDEAAEAVEGKGDVEGTQSEQVAIEILSTLSEERCLLPCLQCCANPVIILLGLFFVMFIQTMVVSGLISSMLTTLERRFNFTTRQVGYMISCFEGSGVLTTVAISFVNGQKHNRLRVVGLATLLLSLAFALFALPHFLIGPYNPDLLVLNESRLPPPPPLTHSPTNSNASRDWNASSPIAGSFGHTAPVVASGTPAQSVDPIQSLALSIFCVAMVLAGVGASPLHVLAPTYLWDNLSDKQYPIYSALFYSAGGLGPACGFLAGAGFLSVYIDSPLVLPRSGLNRNDPSWLGAWWLGMLVCASITLVAALPVIAFPKRLRCTDTSTATNGNLAVTKCDDNNNNTKNKMHDPLDFSLNVVVNSEDQMSVLENVDVPKPLLPHRTALGAQSQTSVYEAARRPPALTENRAHLGFTHRRTQSNQIGCSRSGGRLIDGAIPATATTTNTPQTQTRATSESVLSASWRTRTTLRKFSSLARGASSNWFQSDGKATDPAVGFDGVPVSSLRFHFRERLKSFLLVLRRVLANPVWFGVTFTSMVEQSIVAAFLAFAAKYIQDLFQVPAYLASIHTGAVVVPSSLLGVLSGALVMRHYRPRIDRTLVGVCVLIGITVVTTISLMLISCPGNRVAGLTATYSGEPWPWLYGPARLMDPSLTAPCNTRCPAPSSKSVSSTNSVDLARDRTIDTDLVFPCSSAKFNPVCWQRGSAQENDEFVSEDQLSSIPRYLTFFNPCYAGCQIRNRSLFSSVEVFTNCTCVTATSLNPSGQPVFDAFGNPIAFGHVTAGRCPTDCPQYAVFLAVLFLHILFTGMLQNPSNVITLSCVSPEDSSVALGLQIFFMRTLAYIPAPIYFGQLFDLVCQYRLVAKGESSATNSSCSTDKSVVAAAASRSMLSGTTLPTAEVDNNIPGQVGACLQYNLDGLPIVWLGMILALKLISLMGSIFTWRVAWRQARKRAKASSSASCVSDSGSPRNANCSVALRSSPFTSAPGANSTQTSMLNNDDSVEAVSDGHLSHRLTDEFVLNPQT